MLSIGFFLTSIKKNWAYSQLASLNSSSVKFSVPMEMIVVSDLCQMLINLVSVRDRRQLSYIELYVAQVLKLGATECCDSYSSEPW